MPPSAAAAAAAIAAVIAAVAVAAAQRPRYYSCSAGRALGLPPGVEVVLAHSDEDLAWVSEEQQLLPGGGPGPACITVYSKAPRAPPRTTPLPNVGRESHTYLHHIVAHYDALAGWTVFSQAAEPGYGPRRDSRSSGPLADFLRPDADGFFAVYTAATRYPELYQNDRIDMKFHDASAGEACPRAGTGGGWGGWRFERNHPAAQLRATQPSAPTAVDFYNRFVVAPAASGRYYSNFTLSFANGARFAVSRERIRRRSREYYQRLLGQLSALKNPIEGYFMEAMWYDVFHPEALQAERGPVCALSRVPERVGGHEAMLQGDPTPKPTPKPTTAPTTASPTAPTTAPTTAKPTVTAKPTASPTALTTAPTTALTTAPTNVTAPTTAPARDPTGMASPTTGDTQWVILLGVVIVLGILYYLCRSNGDEDNNRDVGHFQPLEMEDMSFGEREDTYGVRDNATDPELDGSVGENREPHVVEEEEEEEPPRESKKSKKKKKKKKDKDKTKKKKRRKKLQVAELDDDDEIELGNDAQLGSPDEELMSLEKAFGTESQTKSTFPESKRGTNSQPREEDLFDLGDLMS